MASAQLVWYFRRMHRLGTLLGLWLGIAPFAGASPAIEELYRLDRLAHLRDSVKVGCVSSYDRTGGNDDGFSGKYSFLRKDADGLILADLKGPGVIYRIWTPTPSNDVIEFLFDGEETPRLSVPFREIFLGKHQAFPAPLSGFGAGGYYSYVPLPFAKSCVVRARASKVQFYQINYALYREGASIKTYSTDSIDAGQLAKIHDVWAEPGSDIIRFISPSEKTPASRRGTAHVEPGGKQVLFHEKSGGRLAGFQLWPARALAGKTRDLLLKISFDKDEPAVLCPAGDFFGYAWGQPAMRSLLIGTQGETNYCNFPMPFDREITIELLSERKEAVDLHFDFRYSDISRSADEGKFYALWRRENPTMIGNPYTFLDTKGRGHIVGIVLQAQGLESGKTLFFEGDDQTTIDGEVAVQGTGSEDFFNGGWYDVPDRWEKRLSFPLSGCLGYQKHLGRTGGYRFFLGDAYAYRSEIRQTIEHSGEKNSIPTDYCSVTYFYSEERPSANLLPPPLAQRQVYDLQEIVFPAWWQLPIAAWSFEHASLARKKEKIGNEEVRFLSLTATNSDWFGPHFLSPVVDVPMPGEYVIYVEAVKGPAQGRVQLFQNENPVAESVDLYAEQLEKSQRIAVGRLHLSEGKNTLMFKLVGRSERSSGLGLDLIALICRREP